MSSLLYLRLWMLGSIGVVSAVYGRMHEKCVRYCQNEPPEISGAFSVCIKGWDNCTYCKFYNNNCPDIQECPNKVAPIPSRGNRCMICPGEDCIYNGQIYYTDETFDSVDGINTCICMRSGEIKCEEHYLGSPMTFCN
ncbi:uncharacterized protein LOC117317275 [Pecten maximus]|uniref:uncharacterized protein LOC117317275 n=1 Tax=Pecten maximus TaxID=6579 RepID=UPI001458B790|nr:uncharacterized protein LOC117317275 [Pecten maximus]